MHAIASMKRKCMLQDFLTVKESTHLWSVGWTVMVCTISSQQARTILSRLNTRNRKLRVSQVRAIKKSMVNDEFLFTPEPMIFDDQDTIMSAQHRLAALAEIEDGAADFLVIAGVDGAVYRVLDQVSRRTMADAFEEDSRIQGPINLIARMHFGRDFLFGEVEKVREVFLPTIKEIIDECGFKKSKVFGSASFMTMVTLRGYVDDLAYTKEQYSALLKQDYGLMSPLIQSFNGQIATGTINTSKMEDLISRTWRAFDSEKASLGKLQIKKYKDMEEIRAWLKELI